MKKFNPKDEEELLKLIDKINKAYRKKISSLFQLLQKNNFPDREIVRRLVRQARERNDDLFSDCHSLYRFLQQIESQITKKEDELVMNEEILAGRANMIKII